MSPDGTVADLETLKRLVSPEMMRGVIPIEVTNLSQARQRELRVTGQTKVARNSPCPCGSGKKFKHCHMDPALNAMAA
jgi:preprotein translocase subunit SecA